MKKDIYYFNPISVKKSLVIADTTKLATRGVFLKPLPKFYKHFKIDQIFFGPGDRTGNILKSCLRSNIALILVTNN
jgi:hypothetical protein